MYVEVGFVLADDLMEKRLVGSECENLECSKSRRRYLSQCSGVQRVHDDPGMWLWAELRPDQWMPFAAEWAI